MQTRWNLLLVVVAVAACSETSFAVNPDHCIAQSGDATCQSISPDRPFCSTELEGCPPSPDGLGCVAEQPSSTCSCAMGGVVDINSTDDIVSQCQGTSTTSGPTSGATMDTGMGSGDTTMGSSTTVGPACMNDDECTDPTFPVCDGMNCVPCDAGGGDSACAMKDPANPACNADGACVQCTTSELSACADATPVCDDAVNTCRACLVHPECPTSACNLEAGACMPEANVLYVDQNNGCPGSGTMASPYCDLAGAVGAVGAGGTATIRIVDSGTYGERLTLINGETVALLGNGATLDMSSGAPIMDVGNNATLYADDISVDGNSMGRGVDCDGCILYLTRSVVRSSAGGGVSVRGGGKLVLQTTAVAANGGGGPTTYGLDASGAEVYISYSTLAGNDAMANDTLNCAMTTGTVRNSILTGRDANSINCSGVTFENNAADEDLGGTNMPVGINNQAWFQNWLTGDYRLSVMGQAAMGTIAQWDAGNPMPGSGQPPDPLEDADGTAIDTAMPTYPGIDQP